jgi:hypothetical protein
MSPIRLQRSDEGAEDVDALVAGLGRRVGVAGVLEDLNRRARPARPPGRAVEGGFTWDAADAASPTWFPQGITTSADAGERAGLGGRRVLLVSWYSKRTPEQGGPDQGSRVTVVDLDTLTYRHVLLVVPRRRAGRVEAVPLRAHAGGLVWYADHLHVAGTKRGLYTCRLEDLLRVDDTSAVLGHRYVLPVRHRYLASSDPGTEDMRYSFLSLDRDSDPPQLLAGEYAVGKQTRRLVRFPLDPITGHLVAAADVTAEPVWIHDGGAGHMQGAAVARGRFYVTTSRGARHRGRLHVGTPGALRPRRRTLPPGPEDITYWPETDRLWSLTEHPGSRWVFSMPRSWFDRRWHRPW